jgi:RHS repeat-associated protein
MMKRIAYIIFLFPALATGLQAQNINHQNMQAPMGLSINSFNGNLFFQRTDLFINSRKLPFNFTFYYNSNNYGINQGYGNGWSMEYLLRWKAVSNGVLITRGDGFGMLFEAVGTGFKAPAGVFDSLVQYQGGKFKLITKEKMIYFFDNTAHKRLTRIEEINSNFLNFSYTDTLLTQITDAAFRSIQITYQGGKLKQIDDAIETPVRSIRYRYDASGNLTEVTDAAGNKTKYAYLVNGPLNVLTDKNGNAANMAYNAAYQVKELVTCNTHQRFSYDKAKGLTVMTEQVSGQNQTTIYRYNSKGYIIAKQGNCCGFNTKMEYDDNGNTTKFIDANGHASIYTYDNMGNMLSKTDALGKTLLITWNSLGKLTSFTDKNGNTTSFTLDSKGNVTKATYPESITNEFTYAPNGDMLSSEDGNGNITTYEYDNYGNVMAIHKPLGVNYAGSYDARSRLLSVTDPNGHNTGFTNDLLDRITAVADAAGNAVTMTYDANNNITAYTDRKGQPTRFYYDAADRLAKVTNALGHSVQGKYDEHNNLTAYTDERGYQTKLYYDNQNRLTQVINAANEITQYTYTPNGLLSSMVYPNGNTIIITRDARDKITQVKDNVGIISQRQYDAKGNLTAVTDALSNTTSFTYDKLNRLVKRTDPLNFFETYSYDKNYNLLSYKDRNGHIKTVAYDSLNRTVSYTDALDAVTNYTYDPAGNLTIIKDAKNNTTTYTYDNLNRQTNTAYALGTGNSSVYDKNGNVTTYTDGNGVTTNYIYDSKDRLLKMDFPGTDDYLYGYDAAGNLVSAVNADATVNFSYDAINRIASESLNGKTTGYAYNVPGGSFIMNYPGSRAITKTFDARNRLSSIFEGGQPLFSAVYDAANRVITETQGNGGAINYNYDAGGRLLSKFTNSIPALGFQYTYDKAGNKTSEQKTHKSDHSERYFYDNEDQLVEFRYGIIGGNDTLRHQKFIYDKLGNRVTEIFNGNTIAYTSNALNQYTSVNGAVQTYDNNGNLATSGGSNYTFNILNQLTAVNATTFKYDALNRLVKVASPTDTAAYNYSFLNAIEIKKTGSTISNVFGMGLDDLTSLKANGQQYFVLQNNINSVTSITDSANKIKEHYEYDPFGEVHIFSNTYSGLSNSSVGNEIQFGGRHDIAGTGLHNFRYRYLSTQMGRFMQRDPLEYVDGMNNLSFISNNPINSTDPLGLSEIITSSNCKKMKAPEDGGICDLMFPSEFPLPLPNNDFDPYDPRWRQPRIIPYTRPWWEVVNEGLEDMENGGGALKAILEGIAKYYHSKTCPIQHVDPQFREAPKWGQPQGRRGGVSNRGRGRHLPSPPRSRGR